MSRLELKPSDWYEVTQEDFLNKGWKILQYCISCVFNDT